MTTTFDLNGAGDWSLDGIRLRYARHASALGVPRPRQLEPRRLTEGGRTWVYPVIEEVLTGVSEGDRACVAMAVDLVCTDERFRFGKIFKDKAARALRDVELTEEQIARIRWHAIRQLENGFAPPEFRTLAQLVRRIGLGEFRDRARHLQPTGPRVAQFIAYLCSIEPDKP